MALPKASTIVWYTFTALLASTIFITELFYVGIVFGFFLGPELLGVVNDIRGDTYTEFTRWKITDAASRFGYGMMVAGLAYLRFPEPVNLWAAIALGIWLPAHFAFPGVEARAWNAVKGVFS